MLRLPLAVGGGSSGGGRRSYLGIFFVSCSSLKAVKCITEIVSMSVKEKNAVYKVYIKIRMYQAKIRIALHSLMTTADGML
jgi:hypothetical protein